MKKWIFLLALCAAGQHAAVYGQTLGDSTQLQAWNRVAKPGSTLRGLKVRDELKISARDFFTDCKAALGTVARDEFRLLRTNTDDLGMTHYRYQQFYRGYRIEGALYTLHEQQGRVATANGRILPAFKAEEPPAAVAEEKALQYALELVPTKNYLWLDKKAEEALKERTNNREASFYPKGELVWLQVVAGEEFRLAWKFDISTADGLSECIYLDAATYGLLKRYPLDIHCDPGSGNTTWHGTQNINTSQSGSNFILLDDCQSPNIHVFNAQDSSSTAFSTEYTDADNNWTTMAQQSAVQTFYCLTQSWQYYLNQHGRDSYDNGGANINGYNQAGFIGNNGVRNWSNASWSPSQQIFRFGDNGTDGSVTDDWNTIDIIGHEFTHAVTSNEADLVYSAESGALNESFSDIFGEMVELFTTGAQDWLVGANRGYIRNMTNPNDKNDPDTYQGTNWVSTSGTCDGTNDQCGVHTNSGVQNFWFYLLSDGGSGINDNGDFYNVQGIGSTNAANIAYRSLSVYLNSGSGYDDAKWGSIQAAIDLFGDCSNEVLQCARAWNAVGVYSADGLGYDIEVDCPVQDFVHVFGLSYFLDAFNDIRSDCEIAPSNGAPVVYEAGHAVLLKPGFASGDNFHAYIDPCPGSVMALMGSGNSSDRTQNGQTSKHLPVNSVNLEAFPNPFRSKLRIQFAVPAPGPISLRLINAYGHTVYTWYDKETLPQGDYSVLYAHTGLPNGLYTLEMRSVGKYWSRKLVKVGD
ncbi:MAG: M4 family metallopeptidase [Lewinellaceae bacterium]|nr:M4 family metallopeptidase [Lewinellaceae bacterium]